MDVEQQEYQAEESNLSRVGRRSDEPAAEPEQHGGDDEAHAGHDNRDGDEAQVAAAAAHEVALAIAELNMHDHEHAQQQDEFDDDDDESDCDSDMKRRQEIATRQKLAKLASDALSDNTQTRFQAVQAARKLLSGDSDTPIDKLIESGIVPILVKCLTVDTEPQLQLEAAWALTNIASGTSQQTRPVVEAGAVPLLVQLLNSPDSGVCEQAVWALGNIVSDGPELKDQVIELGVVAPLVNFINSESPVSLLRQVAWVIFKLCRPKKPLPPATTNQELLPALHKLIQHHDIEILHYSVRAVNNIAEASDEYIQMVVDFGFVKHLVPLLGHTEDKLKESALFAVGTILTGTVHQTQAVLDEGALSYFPALFQHPESKIKKSAAWSVSNVTACNKRQVQAVIDANLIPLVVMCLRTGDCKIQKEAAWAISNLTISGSPDQIRYCVEQSVIPPLCDLLNVEDTEIKTVVLDSITNILKAYTDNKEELDMLERQIEECGGLEKIKELREDADKKTQELASTIVERIRDTGDKPRSKNDDQITPTGDVS